MRHGSDSALITTAIVLAGVTLGLTSAVHADAIKTVFVIAMENHNWTQPAIDSSAPGQIFNNPNAPFINSLTNPASPNNAQVSFTTAYHNVLATPSGSNPSIHPSEPNYIWMEAGSNLGVFNDNQPFGPGGTNQNTTNHFSSLLTKTGQTWKSYEPSRPRSTLLDEAPSRLNATLSFHNPSTPTLVDCRLSSKPRQGGEWGRANGHGYRSVTEAL